MSQYAEKAMSRPHNLVLRLVLAIGFASQLSVQQCNPNDIKPFPRVLGNSAYPTNCQQMDTNELY